MEWVDRNRVDEYPLVDDFKELLQVIDGDILTEFQYVIND